MKQSCVVSVVVAALALVAVAGCGSEHASKGQGKKADPDPSFDTQTGSPPGMFSGVVQIFKTPNGGSEVLIGCATIGDAGEIWILPQGMNYPVPCALGDQMRFQWVDPAPADQDNDKTVTWQELCASQYGTAIQGTKIVRQIDEQVQILGQCP